MVAEIKVRLKSFAGDCASGQRRILIKMCVQLGTHSWPAAPAPSPHLMSSNTRVLQMLRCLQFAPPTARKVVHVSLELMLQI